jgi:hypothetical protein
MKENRSLRRPRRRLEDNIKIGLKELEPEKYTKLIHLKTGCYGCK